MTTTGGRGRGRGTRSVVDFVFANVAEAFDLFGGLEDSVARRASVIFIALGCTLVEVVLKAVVAEDVPALELCVSFQSSEQGKKEINGVLTSVCMAPIGKSLQMPQTTLSKSCSSLNELNTLSTSK